MSESADVMNRRRFVRAGALGAAGAALAATGMAAYEAEARAVEPTQPAAREHYELRTYDLRNDADPGAMGTFLERHLVPALRRAGAGPVGCFSPDVGAAWPSFMLVVTYPSLAAVGEVADRLGGDREFRAAEAAWERGPKTPYVRYESALYRAFTGHPRITTGPAPTAGATPPTRLFELRTYEAAHAAGLREKIAMFNEGEFPIFRDAGLHAVWFGEAIAATRMPHLAYMIAFDDAAARSRAWTAFGAHPDWPRVRTSRTGFTDGEMVSSIRNALVRPTGYSQVR